MKIRAFITHKLAEKYEDCQDFFSYNEEKKRLAVSDGMTQSIFPQWWAELLSESYVDGSEPKNIDDVETLRKKWIDKVNQFKSNQEEKGKSTWMLENALAEKRGAGATLCGVNFLEENKYNYYVLGDSCLIVVNQEHRILEIKGSHQGNFNNHPDYFDSIQGGKGVPVTKGLCDFPQNGALLLVTDALAEFLERKRREGCEKEYVERLLAVDTNSLFEEIIGELRHKENMHNDDTTLVIIEYDFKEEWCLNVSSLAELIENEKIKDESSQKYQKLNETDECKTIEIITNKIVEQDDFVEENIIVSKSSLKDLFKKLLSIFDRRSSNRKFQTINKIIDQWFYEKSKQ